MGIDEGSRWFSLGQYDAQHGGYYRPPVNAHRRRHYILGWTSVKPTPS